MAYAVKIGVQQASAGDMFLVSFIEEPGPQPPAADANPAHTSRIAQLEQELEETHKQLNVVIRDLEISNEDFRTVNEEALSVNEEFQSTNEELETSKEELQALNEELTALNSQLQETLEQQRATAADLQNILNSSGVATLFLDTAFNIRFFTPAAKSLFGVSIVDIGRPVGDLAQRFQDDALLADARAVLSNLTPARREVESHDGNWYIRSILPYRVAEGTVEGVVITFARITELKEAERNIGGAKAYAESIIATVKQPLAVLDEDLRLVSASASFYQVFGERPEDSIGKMLTLGTGRQQEALAKFLEAANRGGAIEAPEMDIALPKAGPRKFRLSARKIAERSKILISFDDITDAKAEAEALAAAKEAAERANLGKSRFLAAASHDLRQPLQALSLLQGMLADSVSDPAASKLIERLDRTIGAMSDLLDKLLDINQLEAGVVQPRISDFDVNDLLQQLQSEFEIHAAAANITLRVVPCRQRIRSDPRLLEQILRNLLSNATKYTSRGKVLIGCRRRGGRLCIEVWDTGTGIPQTELSAIFKEFHQLENNPGRRGQGLGLGLAIVQRLSDLLGTRISVRSRVGRGSAFAVEVPLLQAPARASEAGERRDDAITDGAVETSSNGQHLILIIEDDEEIRETLKLLLESRGYRAFAARDGAEALAVASALRTGPDLIVADYNLPGANGLDVVAKIREVSGRKIPSILLTGDISETTLREIAEKEFVHLYKPASAQKLISHVSGVLDKGSQSAPDSVFIIDDDPEIRESMRDMLNVHGYRAESFADASSFFEAYSPDRTGCVVTDGRMPEMDGVQLIEHLHKIQPSLRIIMLTAYGDTAMAVRAMKAGAFDFLQKPAKQNELLDCVGRALNYPPGFPEDSSIRQSALAKIKSLTGRQRQILDMVLTGSPSKIIAADLHISQRTVDNHRAAIMRKIGAKSLSTLIKIALTAGRIDASAAGPPQDE
jgi:two-component system CheB/CheR fusion protein